MLLVPFSLSWIQPGILYCKHWWCLLHLCLFWSWISNKKDSSLTQPCLQHLKAHSHYCAFHVRLQQMVAFLQGDRKLLSLRWCSLLRKMQIAASSVNQPYVGLIHTSADSAVDCINGDIGIFLSLRVQCNHPLQNLSTAAVCIVRSGLCQRRDRKFSISLQKRNCLPQTHAENAVMWMTLKTSGCFILKYKHKLLYYFLII